MWKANFFFWNFNDLLTHNYTQWRTRTRTVNPVRRSRTFRSGVRICWSDDGSTDPCLGRNLCSSQEFTRFLADTAAQSAGLEIDTACTLTGTTLWQHLSYRQPATQMNKLTQTCDTCRDTDVSYGWLWITAYFVTFCWPCILIIFVMTTNLMHYLSLIYFVSQPLHVSGICCPSSGGIHCICTAIWCYIYIYIYIIPSWPGQLPVNLNV
jgi:hypothetical protein